MDTLEVSPAVVALQSRMFMQKADAAIEEANLLVRSGTQTPIAVSLVCRAHMAAAASLYATACQNCGALFEPSEMQAMLAGILKDHPVDHQTAEAIVGRDAAKAAGTLS